VDKVTEQEIAAVVVMYLEQLGWDVFHEVEYGSRRADIVATNGPLVRVIEVKTSFTAALIEQAWHWRGLANLVHVAVPRLKTSSHVRGRRVLTRFCNDHGIGVFAVDDTCMRKSRGDYTSVRRVVETEQARLERRIPDWLRSALRDEHKKWGQAGNANNRYWTPFKGTCEQWRRYVESNPGCTLKEIVKAVDHHYASDNSAKGSMIGLIQRGIVPGIESRRDGRKWTLWPKKDPPRIAGHGREGTKI